MNSYKTILFMICAAIFVMPSFLGAQEVYDEYRDTYRARVINIESEETRIVPGTETEYTLQVIRAEILDGPQKGEIIRLENDFLKLKVGDRFFLNYLVDIGGFERYSIVGIDRRIPIYVLVGLFVLAVLVFGRWQGFRSLIALVTSFSIIFYVLIPGILAGWDPVFASSLVAAGILFGAIFFTHGFNRESAVAYGGTMIAVILTGILAYAAVSLTRLSGFASDESIYLNFSTQGTLDFQGLLLGAIIIGILGVLDDIAITQAAVTSELYHANPKMSKMEAYKRVIRVGREHVGALVNTLVLAYTGASLPLLLFFQFSTAGFSSIINMEIFATEIVRTVVGSIGLIMTVPIVTALAAYFLKGHTPKGGVHHGHSHAHGGHGH